MTTPDEAVRSLRQSILRDAPTPASDPADFARLQDEARTAMLTGRIEPPAPEVRVRLFGEGAEGHDIPVETASRILGTIQGIVTAVGSAVRNSGRMRQTGKRLSLARATELRLSPTIGTGSVVFFLRGRPAPAPEQPALGTTGTNTLLDLALGDLFGLLRKAQADEGSDAGALIADIQRLGSRVASRLNALAEEAIEKGVDVDLGWRSPDGRRDAVQLERRAARAIQDAVEASREQVVQEHVVGILHTASDGSDLIRLTPDAGKSLRMRVDPEIGATLGPLLTKRVAATVESRIIWHIASGREHIIRRLVSAELADSVDA